MPRRGEQAHAADGPGRPGLRPAGAVLAVAGAVWWGAAAGVVVSGAVATVVWVAAGAVVGLLVLRLTARLGGERAQEAMVANRRMYALVNVAQVVGFVAVVVLAGRLGAPQWVPVGVAVVFALHFLPFAPAFRWRGYTWLALALLGVAAGGTVLAATGSSAAGVHALVGPAVALVLWGAVVIATTGTRRPAPSEVAA